MNLPYTNMQLIMAALILIIVVLAVVAMFLEHRKTKTRAFRNKFGTEYDRAVLSQGSSKKAEAKLTDRQTRVGALKIRDLGHTERERFVSEWTIVQSRFVDHPKAAVTEADDLVSAILEARGYPKTSFEQRADDLSVTYPLLMENYRQAHAIAVRPSQLEASTEDLRSAMLQYRAIFDELAQPQKPVVHKKAA
jgi:lipopolysaccharide export LptBFGC system permease protein LptF